MANKKVLFISGSLGLGHITRDLAIADSLRRCNDKVVVEWLASRSAGLMLQQRGEHLLGAARMWADDNRHAEVAARGGRLNLLRYLTRASRHWHRNAAVFQNVIRERKYDCVIGDEAYEIVMAIEKAPALKTVPFIMMYDFIGVDAMTRNPLERITAYMWNRVWSIGYARGEAPVFDQGLFVGTRDDVPDKPFDFRLPNRRQWAEALLQFIGYVLPFDPIVYQDKSRLRAKLGYGPEPLIVCAIGGTAIGRPLLQLCADAYPLLKKEVPSLRMVLVCGPRLSTAGLRVPTGVEVHGFVPALYEHYAACDLAIVQGGGTSTLELTALRTPFIYFPIEGHFEQALVAQRLVRHKAGIAMRYADTNPRDLASKLLMLLGTKLNCESIEVDGADKAARMIHNRFLS